MYLIMYVIKNDVNLKKDEVIENGDIYTIVGFNRKGIRQLIGVCQVIDIGRIYLNVLNLEQFYFFLLMMAKLLKRGSL